MIRTHEWSLMIFWLFGVISWLFGHTRVITHRTDEMITDDLSFGYPGESNKPGKADNKVFHGGIRGSIRQRRTAKMTQWSEFLVTARHHQPPTGHCHFLHQKNYQFPMLTTISSQCYNYQSRCYNYQFPMLQLSVPNVTTISPNVTTLSSQC